MNPVLSSIQGVIDDQIEGLTQRGRSIQRTIIGKAIVAKIADQLSEKVHVNAWGGSFWFNVTDRNDLVVLLSLSQLWKKEVSGEAITYVAVIDEIDFRVNATAEALPPTCHIVEEDVVIPARTEKRRTVKCDQVLESVETDNDGEPTFAEPLPNDNPT